MEVSYTEIGHRTTIPRLILNISHYVKVITWIKGWFGNSTTIQISPICTIQKIYAQIKETWEIRNVTWSKNTHLVSGTIISSPFYLGSLLDNRRKVFIRNLTFIDNFICLCFC